MELPKRWPEMNDDERGKWLQMMATKYQDKLDWLKRKWREHINVKWPKAKK